MSKQRAKGTRNETSFAGFLSDVFTRVRRTAFDHSTAWGSADLAETGRFSVECKHHADHLRAIGSGWPQAVRNAAYCDKIPVLQVRWPRKGVADSLVIMRAEDWKELVRDAVPDSERNGGR